MKADDAPVFIPAYSGKVLDFLAITHKLTSQQAGGACYIFESAFDPETGNQLHVHGREDEIAYVLDGALEVRFPGEPGHSTPAASHGCQRVSPMRSAIPSRRRRGTCSSPFPVASICGSTQWPTRSAPGSWTMKSA